MSYLRFLAYLLGGVIGLVAVAVVLLFSVDLGIFKPQVEKLASDILGRDFEINGPVHLNLGSSIELSAERVRLAGTPWSAEPDLVSVKTLEVAVDLRSLLQGPIMVERLYVDGIRVHLEQDAKDNNNWTFFEETEPEPEPTPPDEERFRLPVFATDIRITDTLLVYAEPGQTEPLRLLINSITETIVGSDQVKLALAGEFNDTALGLQASSTGIENLIALLDVKFDLAGNLGEIVFDGNFAFADLLNPRHPTGVLTLDGPNMEYLLDRLQMEPFTSGPLNLVLNVAPRDEKMHLALDGVFGEFNLAAQGSFVDLQHLEEIDLEFKAGGPDIGRVAQLAGVEKVPNDPFTVGGALHRSGADISIDDIAVTIGDTRFDLDGEFKDFPDPDKAQADIRLHGPDIGRFSQLLGLPGKFDGPFSLDGRLEPLPGDKGAVVRLNATTNGLNLAADGNILDTPEFAGSEIRINLNGPTLSTITTALELENTLDAPFSVDVAIERIAGGATIRDGRLALGDEAEYTVSLAGTITEQAGLLGSHIELGAQGPSLAELTAAAGIEVVADLPFDLAAEVTVVETGYALKQVRADLGPNRATVTGVVGVDPLAADTDVAFTVTSPDLKGALAAFGIENENLPAGDLDASGAVSAKAGRIGLQDIVVKLAGTTLKVKGDLGELPELEGSTIQLDIAGSNLSQLLPPDQARSSLARPFSLAAGIQVAQQELRIESARFEIARTVLTADTRFRLEPMLGSGQFSLRGKSPDVLLLLPEVAEVSSRDALPLDLVAEGRWADNLWTVKQLDLKLAASNLQVKGSVAGPPDFGKTDLRLNGKVGSLQQFSKLAGRPLPDEPGNISFHLVGRGDVMTLETFEGRLGDSDFKGDFTLRHGDVPDITLALTSKRLNLKPYLPPEPEVQADVPPEPAPPEDKKRKLIPDTPLPMDELNKLQARVDLRFGEINLRAETLTDVVLAGSLQGGALVVEKFELKATRGGMLGGSLSLRPDANGAVLRTRVNGSNLSLGLPAATPEDLKALPRYEFALALQSLGKTVRDMAGNANGYLRLVAGKGQTRVTAARFITNDFLEQLLSTVNPFAVKDPYTRVHCAVVLAAVEAGQFEGKPLLVVKTDRLNIFADTEIDLRTEKLRATFNTVPQKGLGISLSNLVNPYVAVIGTLGNPQISLDPEATVIQGGVAVATMGLSILAKGFKDRFLSSKKPCKDALKLADKDLKKLQAKYAQPNSQLK